MSPIKENIHLTNWEIVSVNPTNKNWNWKDIFCFWTVGTQSIISFALLGSLYLLYNLNFYEVLFGSMIIFKKTRYYGATGLCLLLIFVTLLFTKRKFIPYRF